MKVKSGTIWTGADNSQFIVIDVVELEGKIWVHYRKDSKTDSQEYSCYEESFLARFRENVNKKYQHFL